MALGYAGKRARPRCKPEALAPIATVQERQGPLARQLDDIRARNLAAQTRPNDPTPGIEIGGR